MRSITNYNDYITLKFNDMTIDSKSPKETVLDILYFIQIKHCPFEIMKANLINALELGKEYTMYVSSLEDIPKNLQVSKRMISNFLSKISSAILFLKKKVTSEEQVLKLYYNLILSLEKQCRN